MIRTGQIAAHADPTVGMLPESKIDSFPFHPFDLREQSARGLGIVPHVRAGALTASDPFPSPEAAVLKAITGRRRQRRRVGHRAVEQPVGQRRVVPGIDPLSRVAGQPLEIRLPCSESRPVPSRTAPRTNGRPARCRPLRVKIGKVPGDDKINSSLFARPQLQ